MNISGKDVMALRERTGAGISDCKKCLEEAEGNIEKAIELLREKGMASAAKKAGRIAAEGIVDSYIHMGGKVGVLVEIDADNVNDDVKAFAHDVALQIAAAKPLYVNKEDVPADVLEHEKEILRAQALNEGKPEKIVDKMVEGRIEKYYKEVCLLEQPFVKDPDKSIAKLMGEVAKEIGAELNVVSFERFERDSRVARFRVYSAADNVGKIYFSVKSRKLGAFRLYVAESNASVRRFEGKGAVPAALLSLIHI